MRKSILFGLTLGCTILLAACQAYESNTSIEKESTASSSSSTTVKTEAKEGTTSSSSSSVSKTEERDYETLYAETLSKVIADPERVATHYAFYDIDSNGTSELFTGYQSSDGEMTALALYYLKNDLPTYLANTAVAGAGGYRAGFRVNLDGTVTQFEWTSHQGKGTKKTYQLEADNSGATLIEEKEVTMGNPEPSEEPLDMNTLDWQPLEIPEISQGTSQQMDVAAIKAGDYSSLYGTWVKPNGETVTFDASSFGEGSSQITYKKDINGGLMFGLNAPSGGQVFYPIGVEFGDTDSSRERFNATDISFGSVHEVTYYRQISE
ncbi:TPA: DUF6287 domain-containing protein [Streptococcus suis]